MPGRNERRSRAVLLLVAFLLAAASCDRSNETRRIDCDIDRGPCVREVAGERLVVVFDVTPKPVRLMSDLVFAVTLHRDAIPLEDAAVRLELSMPGMYMGVNSTAMLHVGNGRYEARGVIVRCESGGKVWKARLSIRRPAEGESRVADVEYIFAVHE